MNQLTKYILIIHFLFYLGVSLSAQDTIPRPKEDSLPADTIETTDTAKKWSQANYLDTKVNYDAQDSIIFSNDYKKVYLYNNAKVNYGSISIEAARIEYNFKTNQAIAKGITDTAGNYVQRPHFNDGNEEFDADTLRYNFETKEGLIYGVMTEQNDGYLHSKLTKRHKTGEFHVSDGKYTTCDRAHPHFYVRLTKAIVNPNGKIVSGPLYFVIHDVPVYFLYLPFGVFPNTQEYNSGIIMPEYGEEQRRGFFLRNGGYYFALNDYMDLAITGDVYSNGTWGTNISSNYKLRYKFSGNVNIRYRNDVSGIKGLPDYSRNNSFSIRWSHRQAAKANPYRDLSASVNFQTNGFNKKHSENLDEYLESQKSSNISYRRQWPDKPFNLTANLSADQNTSTNKVNMSLPVMNFNVNRIYPFKKYGEGNTDKWYNDLQFSYKAGFKNRLSTTDSTLFDRQSLNNLKTGFEHRIPISLPINIFNDFTLSPNIDYKGVMYKKSIRKHWVDQLIQPRERTIDGETRQYTDTIKETVVTDTLNQLSYAHQVSTSLSFGYNTRLYGMYQFKPEFINKRIKAIRHVINPSVNFSYTPQSFIDDSKYYKNYRSGYSIENGDTTWREKRYSIYEGVGMYGTPRSSNRSGSINFSLSNNVEMKVSNPQDTSKKEKKIKLLENLSMNTSYNIFADSLNWSKINISGSTSLLDNINIRFGGTFDPYTVDSTGNTIDEFEFTDNQRLARLTDANFSLSMSLNPNSGNSESGESDKKRFINPFYPYSKYAYANFNAPWDISLNYNFYYSKNKFNPETQEFESSKRQTLSFNGSLSPTDKWDISFRSGYDFEQNKITSTSIDINRDLHCWQMSFNWVPFGPRKSFHFQISIKSSVFSDLKYEKNERYY